jgi:digalactosyldiacylglycerol synthase
VGRRKAARQALPGTTGPPTPPTPSPRLTAPPPPLQAAHNTLTGVESLRVAAGAGSNTKVAPVRVADYKPCTSDEGGFFDDKARARKHAVKAK